MTIVEYAAPEVDKFKAGFEVVDKRRVGRTIFDYDCAVMYENLSDYTLGNLQLEIVDTPASMLALEPVVIFGRAVVGPGQSARSIDTCTIRVNRAVAIEESEIVWDLTAEIVNTGQTIQYISSSVFAPETRAPSFLDVGGIADQWLWTGQAGDIGQDMIADGTVNFMDFAEFAQNWGMN
jgi:hypothetical protein